jgi:transcriptional regulator GlxA family with amidase domain
MRELGMQPTNSDSHKPDDVRDRRIVKFIEMLSNSELGQGIDLDRAAASLNLSGFRFRHVFKNEVGVSPRSYIRTLRLRRARILLEQSFLRVKEVMHMVGYSDASRFVRDYRTLFLVTPSETRTSAWLRMQSHSATDTANNGNK